MRLLSASLLFICACGRWQFASHDTPDAPGGPGGDAGSGDAAPLGPFGTPQLVTAISDPLTDDDPTITGDGLELFFTSERGGAATGYADIYVAKRATVNDAWGAPTPVAELNSIDEDQSPGVAADGLTIYLSSRRPCAITGTSSNTWVATRPDRNSAWSTPALVMEVSSTFDEFEPQPDSSNTHLVFYRQINATDREIFEATRPNTSSTWSTPVPITEINTIGIERSPFLSADGLTIWFSSDRASTTTPGVNDIYVATRTSAAMPFGPPTPVTELNTSSDDDDPSLSADGRIMVITNNTTGNYEVYESRR